MEKISAKEFFTVMWRGLCQALGWFFGLFGYKKDGKFAKCVWGLFATSGTVILTIIAVVLVCAAYQEFSEELGFNRHNCESTSCYENEQIEGNIYYHDSYEGKKYVYNAETGEKTVKHVEWIARPSGKDSLVCFSNGKKRGYFNKNTGKVVVEPKYDHAWIFSDGLACVDEGGSLKFIDGTGEVVIDNGLKYQPYTIDYVFHDGYCIVLSEDGEKYGLMDKTGGLVLPMEYDGLNKDDEMQLWSLRMGDEMAVLDKNLKEVLPMSECSIYVGEGTIDVTMPDHTLRKYDPEGNLIYDFYISTVRTLEYEKDEIVYRTRTHDDDGDEYAEAFVEAYHPKATARLRAYVAGGGYEGLMTADGHVVTMPLYQEIEAIGQDIYLCTSTNYDKVVVNGKGETVK